MGDSFSDWIIFQFMIDFSPQKIAMEDEVITFSQKRGSSIQLVNSVSYQSYKFDRQPQETSEYNLISADRKHVMKVLIINITEYKLFFLKKCQVWGQFVVVFISVGTGDGCLLMINLSVIFVMNHFTQCFGTWFIFLCCDLSSTNRWVWDSSPTCVTTSRCYLQLKSLSSRQ